MKHVTKYLNVPLIEEAIVKIAEERTELIRKNAALRTQMCRLKKLLQNHKQLELEIPEEPEENDLNSQFRRNKI